MRSISLRVLCEGQTEQGFVGRVLAPHLAGFRVFARSELLVPGGAGVVSFANCAMRSRPTSGALAGMSTSPP